jgi:hypothetical protein
MIVANTPRWFRSLLSVKAQTGVLPVFALSPQQTGQPLWRFAVQIEGKDRKGNPRREIHLIGKGVSSRDKARIECKRRYNQSVKEPRNRKAA